jgi:hypothetical protein
MITVLFNDPSEFCAELRREPPEVGAPVRLTKRVIASSALYYSVLWVTATYLQGSQIVRLDFHCGRLLGVECAVDDDTAATAQRTFGLIYRVAEEVGRPVAGGIFLSRQDEENKDA